MNTSAPTSLNCPTCGAPLDAHEAGVVVRCKFCGNASLIPGASPIQAAQPSAALEEIRRLAAKGAKGDLIEAIKKYRQVYNVGLPEAKQAVEALQAGRMASPSTPDMPSSEELTRVIEEVQRLLKGGDKINAIKIYRQNYDVSLARAKYAIDQIEAGQTLHPEAGFQTAQMPKPSVPYPSASTPGFKSNKRLGCIVTVLIVLLIGGIIAYVAFLPGGPFVPHYIVNGKAILLPSGQNPSPDFVMTLYNSDADNRFVGLLNGETGKLGWKGAPLAKGGMVDSVTAGPNLVYVTSGTDLLAYSRNDGSLVWQAKMADRLNYSDSSLLVSADRVITNTVDQSLQAYNATAGSPAWSKRLSGYDRTLRQVGGSLMVVDYIGDNYDYGLVFLNPVTGEQQNAYIPSCTYNDYESTIDPDSGFVYDAAGKALYLVYDSSYGCIQRLDPSTGQVVWSTSSKDSFHFSPDGFQYLLTESTLYFSTGDTIMAVDTSTGEMKALISDPDYDLIPLTLAGDKLIARAHRTRGTAKFELWGLEAASGASAWKIDLQEAEPIDPPDRMAGLVDQTGWGWTWRLTPSGLTLITFKAEPSQMVLANYSLADGSSLGSQVIPMKNVYSDFYDIPVVMGESGGLVYLNIDQGIYSLDLTAAKLKQIY